MKSFNEAVRAYLGKIGQLNAVVLGGETVEITQNDSRFLEMELASQRRFNNTLLIAAVTLLYLIFAVGVYLVWDYKDNPVAMTSVLGGNLLSLIAIVRWMRQLWIEKNATDLFMRAAKELSPEQAANLVTTYYNLMMQAIPQKRARSES